MNEYKVLILTAPSGHLTLANAVKTFIEDIPQVTIKTIDLVGDRLEWKLFRFMYRYAPFLMKIPFLITSNLKVLQIIKNTNIRRYKIVLTSILEQEDPDLVITAYHGYIPILDQIRGKFKFKYINPISDPISLHPILFSSSADYNIGFDDSCQVFGQKLKISAERIASRGWFTARSFFKDQPLLTIRKEIGLQDQFTLMVCAGSEGNIAILMLLPVLFFSKHPRDFQLIFITGHNSGLSKTIRWFYRIASKVNPHLPVMTLSGYTDKMQEFIAVSDVVIGKAGPNLIFECVARQKPFIAISHINGNEDGNLGMITENNLGWVAENPLNANRLIKELIANPGMLLLKQNSLEKMTGKCYAGGMFLRERVQEWSKLTL